MAMENESLKKEIDQHAEKGNIKAIEEIKENASMEFNGDIEGYAENAIKRIHDKSEEVNKELVSITGKENQVTKLGGTTEGLQTEVANVNQKINENSQNIRSTEKETEQKINEVRNLNSEMGLTNENITVPNNKLDEIANLDTANTETFPLPLETQQEKSPVKLVELNKATQEQIAKIEEKEKKPEQIRLDGEIAKLIGSNFISFKDISNLDAEKKAKVLDFIVETSSYTVVKNAELLSSMSKEQLEKLNKARGFIHSVDTSAATDILGNFRKIERTSSEFKSIKESSKKFVDSLPANSEYFKTGRDLYAVKYAEMFAGDLDGKVNPGLLKENLASVMKFPSDAIQLRESIGKMLDEKGILELGRSVSSADALVGMLGGDFVQKFIFKDKSLFEQLANSKKNLKSYLDNKDTNHATDLLKIYVGLRSKGVLSEEEFKKLTTIESV